MFKLVQLTSKPSLKSSIDLAVSVSLGILTNMCAVSRSSIRIIQDS